MIHTIIVSHIDQFVREEDHQFFFLYVIEMNVKLHQLLIFLLAPLGIYATDWTVTAVQETGFTSPLINITQAGIVKYDELVNEIQMGMTVNYAGQDFQSIFIDECGIISFSDISQASDNIDYSYRFQGEESAALPVDYSFALFWTYLSFSTYQSQMYAGVTNDGAFGILFVDMMAENYGLSVTYGVKIYPDGKVIIRVSDISKSEGAFIWPAFVSVGVKVDNKGFLTLLEPTVNPDVEGYQWTSTLTECTSDHCGSQPNGIYVQTETGYTTDLIDSNDVGKFFLVSHREPI